MSNSSVLDIQIESKRIRGQWSGAMTLLEKAARRYAMGYSGGSSAESSSRDKYSYWIAMAEVMIEIGGDREQVLECITKAQTLQLGDTTLFQY